MDKQQTQILSMIDQQNTINDSYANEIKQLKQQQNQHNKLIHHLQTRWLDKSDEFPSTPASIQHMKKKSRQESTQEETSLTDNQNIYEFETIEFTNDTSMLLKLRTMISTKPTVFTHTKTMNLTKSIQIF
jgi:hypothetical protein